MNIIGDAQKLHRDFADLPTINGLFELSDLANAVDADRWAHKKSKRWISLQDLVAAYLNGYLAKGDERCSNWELAGPWAPAKDQMSGKQLDCALRGSLV